MRLQFSRNDWLKPDDFVTLDEYWTYILAEMLKAIELHVPLFRLKNRNTKSYLSAKTMHLIHQKKILWDVFMLRQDQASRDIYNKVRNACTAALRADRRGRQIKLADSFITQPKRFFSHVASMTKSRAALSTLSGPSGLVTSNREVAAVLRESYSAVFKNNQHCDAPYISRSPTDTMALQPDFSVSNIIHKLKKLKPDKSPGLDNIPPIMLQECAEELSRPLSLMFTKSYELSLIPNTWKLGVISPIYKGGDRTDPSNYRPIALLPVVSKVMESILDDAFRKMLKEKSFLSPRQHGFRAGFSCVTNLLTTHDEWTEAADTGKPVDAVYLDFSKAFDRVDHNLLLHKVRKAGFDEYAHAWLSNYLWNRRYTVRVNGSLSEPFAAPTGVPQGSILGPLLFLIFINDLPEGIRSLLVLYADDGKISRVIGTPADEETLQSDISTAYAWSVVNNLPFNTSKCKVLHIRNRRPRTYYLGNTPLTATDHERDLGTVVSSSLSLSHNTMHMTKKANGRLAMLGRILGQFPQRSFVGIFTSLIRPLLETNIQACSPFLVKDVKALENVQRRATKRVSGLRNLTYENRLQQLNLFTVTYRRARGDLILTYRILTNSNHPNRGLFTLATTSNLRGHKLKLFVQGSRLLCRQHSFALRVCPLWNALPSNVVTATSIESFKSKLDTWLQPRWPLTEI
ncbi:MAG: RNA-directed DNA polymerase, partial [Aeromonas sp.]